MKNILVSKFSNYQSPIPVQNVYLLEYLKDDTHKNLVEYIRTLTDKEEIKYNKSKLPAITPSGTFQKRNKDGLIEHSGYICIDIDGGHNPHINDFGMVRDELKKCVNVAYASLSVSGKGVFCFIPIKEKKKHAEHFEALKIIFESFGIIIDKACKDVPRLRGYSYDSKAYINEDAVFFNQLIEYKEKTSPTQSPKKEIKTSYKNTSNNTEARVMKIISEINSKGIDITENYEQWFQVACSLANEFGESGRDMFILVSQNHPKYHPEVADTMFDKCLENSYGYNIGTFFHWASYYDLK